MYFYCYYYTIPRLPRCNHLNRRVLAQVLQVACGRHNNNNIIITMYPRLLCNILYIIICNNNYHRRRRRRYRPLYIYIYTRFSFFFFCTPFYQVTDRLRTRYAIIIIVYRICRKGERLCKTIGFLMNLGQNINGGKKNVNETILTVKLTPLHSIRFE